MKSNQGAAILFFNKPAMTLRCLASVRQAEEASGRAQRLILLDNGSTRDSSQIMQARMNDIGSCSLFVQLPENQGFARAMNAALRNAFSNDGIKVVTLISNDVELAPDYFSALDEVMESSQEARPAIFCPEVFFLYDRSKTAYTHGNLDLESWELSHHVDREVKDIRFPRYYPAAITSWTRAAFDRSGGFNEKYFCYWEDVELSLRASILGIALAQRSKLRAYHLGRGTTGGKPAYFRYFKEGRELTKAIFRGERGSPS